MFCSYIKTCACTFKRLIGFFPLPLSFLEEIFQMLEAKPPDDPGDPVFKAINKQIIN